MPEPASVIVVVIQRYAETHSSPLWDRIKPLMHAEDNATFIALRSGFRNGIPNCTDPDNMATVAATFKILADTGGEKLVGKSKKLSEGTFWSGFKLPACPKN